MGRYPIPTTIKIAQGTQRDDQSTPNEPTFAPISKCEGVDQLDEHGVKEWNRIFPLLNERGLATQADEVALLEWCFLVSKLRFVRSKITNDTLVVGERLSVSPYLKVYDSLFDKMLKMCAKFGFTPADRTRINMPEPIKEKSQKDLIRRAG